MVLTAFALSCLIAQAGSTNLDDRDVIQKVLLLNLKEAQRKSSDVRFVVIRSRYVEDQSNHPPTRGLYEKWLDELIQQKRSEISLEGRRFKSQREEAAAQLEILNQLTESDKVSQTYVPAPIVPLKSLNLEPAIIVSDDSPPWSRFKKSQSSDGRLEKVVLFARLWPVSYSADGSKCVVAYSFPWSIHAGRSTYILTRRSGGWTVAYHEDIYYV